MDDIHGRMDETSMPHVAIHVRVNPIIENLLLLNCSTLEVREVRPSTTLS